MKTQKDIVDIAREVGYDKFNPDYFANNELNDKTWLLELVLLEKWLRDVCYVRMWVEYMCIDSETYEYAYEIRYFPKELENEKRMSSQIKIISSFDGFGGTYSGAWDKYEDALNEGVYKALKIVVQNNSLFT